MVAAAVLRSTRIERPRPPMCLATSVPFTHARTRRAYAHSRPRQPWQRVRRDERVRLRGRSRTHHAWRDRKAPPTQPSSLTHPSRRPCNRIRRTRSHSTRVLRAPSWLAVASARHTSKRRMMVDSQTTASCFRRHHPSWHSRTRHQPSMLHDLRALQRRVRGGTRTPRAWIVRTRRTRIRPRDLRTSWTSTQHVVATLPHTSTCEVHARHHRAQRRIHRRCHEQRDSPSTQDRRRDINRPPHHHRQQSR